MKTKTVNLYQFHELPERMQDKVVSSLWDINVDCYWWESVYDDFSRIARQLGVEADLRKTYFSGFYHQGQGSAFNGEVSVANLIRCVAAGGPSEADPFTLETVKLTAAIKRIANLIDSGAIRWSSNVRSCRRMSVEVENCIQYMIDYASDLSNLGAALAETENFVSQVCTELNRFLFRSLRTDFDYLTSKEAIIETILANEYYFTEHGKLDSHLGT